MTIDLGNFALLGAFLLTVYGFVVGIIGGVRSHRGAVQSSIRAVHASTILSVVSIVFLAAAFLRHDYKYAYVWKTSNNAMSPVYLISAVWGGMDGSMLLWAVMLCCFASAVFLRSNGIPERLLNWLPVPLHGATGFFLGVTALSTNPFRLSPVVASDGNGLNPLLQNPSMMIHPPSLYLGFTGLVVPFAFAFAVLLSGTAMREWAQLTRRWTLVAWGFLTAGIILGGNWAYIELGWGGFWAWDPVENASFLPWLAATALLHSIMVEERRGMLRLWNVVLALLGYLLSVFGTFLTRSGVVQSVHAFAKSDIGTFFLAYIGVASAVALALIAFRYKNFQGENRFESLFSREAVFLFNNLILLAICFATLWGVMFPVFSEALTGEKIAVGPPFFNKVNTPLFLLLLFFMGVGPLISWRKASAKGFWKIFAKPLLWGGVVTVVCLIADHERYLTAVSFGLSAFVLSSVFGEYHRAVKARKLLGASSGLVQVIRSRPQRYGGLLVHVGVAVMAISITASMGYKTERDIILKPNERYDIGRFSLNLLDIHQEDHENYAALVSTVQVFERGGDVEIGRLHPERRSYKVNEEVTTEVDIRITPREDLYLALAGIEGESNAVMKVFINPLQMWLWVGSILMLGGTAVVLLPRGERLKSNEELLQTVGRTVEGAHP